MLAPVDPAIQLGDGGTGITTEINAFYSISKTIDVFMNAFGLFNPREQNGVSNLKGRNPSSMETANNTTVMSVPDQYDIRGGATVEINDLVFSAAVRYERLPLKDLIGGNKGFRRRFSKSNRRWGNSGHANRLNSIFTVCRWFDCRLRSQFFLPRLAS